MTDHPCKGMTEPQREAFERIAISQHPMAQEKTIEALLKRGVIARDANEVLGRDAFGTITVPRYYVPMPVHMQWCDWASENVTDDELG